MKPGALVALADACNVSLEWLAAGRGPMRHDDPPAAPPPTTVPELFQILDMDIMAICIETAYNTYARRGVEIPWRNVARLAALSYNEIVDAEAREPAEAPETLKTDP